MVVLTEHELGDNAVEHLASASATDRRVCRRYRLLARRRRGERAPPVPIIDKENSCHRGGRARAGLTVDDMTALFPAPSSTSHHAFSFSEAYIFLRALIKP